MESKFESIDLHGVFAYTIYGDRIRVSHYGPWGDIQRAWDVCDTIKRQGAFPLVNFFAVRSWDDPDWNTARYRSLDTVMYQEPV